MPAKGWIEVSDTYCKGCELCIVSCPQESLGLSSQINLNGYKYAELIKDNCTGCINCAIICPESAITVYRQPKTARKNAPAEVTG